MKHIIEKTMRFFICPQCRAETALIEDVAVAEPVRNHHRKGYSNTHIRNSALPNHFKPYSSEEDKLILEMHGKGNYISEIASRVGRTRAAVEQRVVQMRRKGLIVL